MRYLTTSLVLAFLLTITCLAASPAVQATVPEQQVVILMIDKLSIDDLDPQNTPAIWSLKDRGGIGLLNTLTGGDRTTKNGCATISAGKLAVGSNEADQIFMVRELIDGERAGDVFARNTGVTPVGDNAVVGAIRVIKKNNEALNLGTPGRLGDELKALGMQTAVIGNSDRPGDPSRPGGIVLMDSRGIVDHSFIGQSAVKLNPGSAYPAQSNYPQMLDAYRQLKDNNLVLIEYGDLTRLEAMYSLFSKARYQRERRLILSNIDKSVAQIIHELPAQSCVYLISPSPSRNSFVPKALLTPLIIVKPGFNGILTSHSTRHEGVVLSINLKNSILNCVNPSRSEAIFARTNPDSYQVLQNLNQREVFSYVNQTTLLTIIIIFSLLVLLMAIIRVIRGRPDQVSTLMLLFCLGFPLSLLLIGFFDIFERSGFILTFLAINLTVAAVGWLLARVLKINPLLPVLIATVIVIAGDLLLHNTLLSNSIMSYRVISGARYYGLGNEYMGVLIGATISLAALLRNSRGPKGQLLAGLLFIAVTFLIAYPRFGIDVGGAITACIGLGYTYFAFKPSGTVDVKKLVYLLILALLLVIAMVLIDLKQPAEFQSHLGGSISLIQKDGLSEVLNIIVRKMHMQLRLMSYSGLGWILLLFMAAAMFYMIKPGYRVQRLKNKTPIIYKGLLGLLLSAIVAILFNDSGITSAANLTLYFAVLMFFFWNPNDTKDQGSANNP